MQKKKLTSKCVSPRDEAAYDLAISAHAHWGESRHEVANFYESCVLKALALSEGKKRRKALDVGCGLGRATFELARRFDEVTGIDISTRYIRAVLRLKESGVLPYNRIVEGDIAQPEEVRLRKFGLEHASKKVNFWQADACKLKPLFTGYDMVVACNVLDRLYDPAAFLETIKTRILKGGILVLASPYDWRETYTPKAGWLGGFCINGKAVTTMETLRRLLQPEFALIATEEIAFVREEGTRIGRCGTSELSIWERQ